MEKKNKIIVGITEITNVLRNYEFNIIKNIKNP
jgi:cAMP phosphodiesterase